jgi:hypothetical protein
MTDRDYAELAHQAMNIRGLSIDSHDPMAASMRRIKDEYNVYGPADSDSTDAVPMKGMVREKEES